MVRNLTFITVAQCISPPLHYPHGYIHKDRPYLPTRLFLPAVMGLMGHCRHLPSGTPEFLSAKNIF